MALPAFVVFLLIGFATLNAFAAKVRLVDTAGVAARAAARGEPVPSADLGTAPAGATISVSRDGDTVRVTITQRLKLGPLPSITLGEQATALVEPEWEEP